MNPSLQKRKGIVQSFLLVVAAGVIFWTYFYSMLNKRTIYIILLILSVLFQYFEWGTTMKAFAIEMMLDIFSNKKALFHPLIILPSIGLAGLFYSLLNPKAGNGILWISMAISSILILLTFFVALISMKLKMAISPTIFIIVSVLLILDQNKSKKPIITDNNS